QPALAQAFEAGSERKSAVRAKPAEERQASLPDLVRECVRGYTLQTVFARDLVAAHNDGLLTLTGLDAPLELAGCATGKPPAGGWTEALIDARAIVGGVAAVEGLEFGLEAEREPSATRMARNLILGLRATRLGLVVNLNIAKPPSWADDLAAGPLFRDQRRPPDPQRFVAHSDALMQIFLGEEVGSGEANPGSIEEGGECEIGEHCREVRPFLFPSISFPPVRIDWHLSERDFLPEAGERLLRAARHALTGAALAFVFDRPRRSIALAEGMDRKNPAVLLVVGLHLPRLLDQPGVRRDPELFLKKLGSLARLALSAGMQKREFLRRHAAGRPTLTREFLLDRARLVAAPVGLETVVRALSGAGLCEPGGLDLGRRIVERLRQVLHEDGLASRLFVQLDLPLSSLGASIDAEGLTSWDATATVKNQIKTAGALHAVAGSGTTTLFSPDDEAPSADQIADWLRWAWVQSDVVRLRCATAAPAARQLTLRMDQRAT
ncbi:MAG TPA: hypothetical protein VGG61_01675, partial [Gemmataceae bacterium]